MKRSLIVILLISIAASGCTVTGIQKDHSKQQTNTSVKDVVDGDTVDIRFGEEKKTVRLIGVDTPEVHVENSPSEFEKVPNTTHGRECLEKWGEKASAYAKKKLLKKNVTFLTDPNSDVRGSYGRLLGYIEVNSRNFNYMLVKNGYARVYTSGFSKQEKFLKAEQKAQENLKGLWQCRGYEIENLNTGN